MTSYKKYSRNQPKEAKKVITWNDKCYDLHNQDRLPVAYASQGIRSLSNRLLLFSQMEVGGTLWGIDTPSSRIGSKSLWQSFSPSIGLIDSKSARTSHHIDSSEYGIDGEKKVKGRKEHIIVDTLGLPMAVKIHAANIHDSVGAIEPIKQLRYIVAP